MFEAIIFLSIFSVVYTTTGIDVSQSVTKAQFECLKDNGHRFVVVRAYRNNGIVDANSAQTIRNARAAGIKQVDAYLLPCVSCGDASQQVIETIEYLRDEQADIDILWFDIEGRWNQNSDMNIEFVEQLIEQSKNLGVKFGIYTSQSEWMTIMNNITKFSSISPLWYPNYDNDKSFTDFRTFGGWQQPTMKQFISDVKECGVILDRNFS